MGGVVVVGLRVHCCCCWSRREVVVAAMLKLVLLECCSCLILREAYTISLLYCKIYNIIMQSNKQRKVKKRGGG